MPAELATKPFAIQQRLRYRKIASWVARRLERSGVEPAGGSLGMRDPTL